MQGPNEGSLALLFRSYRSGRSVERKEQQDADLDVLLGFLLQAQRSGKHRVATVARIDDGFPTDGLAEQVEAQHPPVSPVGGMDVVDDHVLGSLTDRVHAEAFTPAGANLLDHVVDGFRRGMPGQRHRLNAGIEVLQLQLIGSPRPVVHRHQVAARDDAGQAAQHHLVSAHALAQRVLDVIDRESEALLLLDLAALLLDMPLPANPSTQPRH